MRSVLVVEYKTYGVSNTPGNDLFDVPLNRPVQASVLCHYLLDTHCLDLYEWALCFISRADFSFENFSDDGDGCRHRCAVALEKLAEGGFVAANAGAQFREYEQVQARKFGTMCPTPRIEGSFYNL